jgi:hypothetical protein
VQIECILKLSKNQQINSREQQHPKLLAVTTLEQLFLSQMGELNSQESRKIMNTERREHTEEQEAVRVKQLMCLLKAVTTDC